jgi:hypothetical protein
MWPICVCAEGDAKQMTIPMGSNPLHIPFSDCIHNLNPNKKKREGKKGKEKRNMVAFTPCMSPGLDSLSAPHHSCLMRPSCLGCSTSSPAPRHSGPSRSPSYIPFSEKCPGSIIPSPLHKKKGERRIEMVRKKNDKIWAESRGVRSQIQILQR